MFSIIVILILFFNYFNHQLKAVCYYTQVQDATAEGGAPAVNAIVYIQNLLELKSRYDR